MKTTPPRLLSLNSYHYRRGGSDVVYLEHDALFQELGWETAVMSMHHPKNMPSRWSEYFVEELEFGNAHGIKDKLVKASKAIYSFEAQDKLRKLLKVFPADVAHLHCIYHHLSPSVLPVLHEAGIPSVLTAHDLKIACPAYKMLNSTGVCERCKDGSVINVLRHRCVRNSLGASAIVMLESGLSRTMNTWQKYLGRVVAPSHFYRNKLIEWGWPEWQVTYVPNYVDVNAFTPSYEPGDYVLFAGRLAPEKGVATLARAAAQAGQGSGGTAGGAAGGGGAERPPHRIAHLHPPGKTRKHGLCLRRRLAGQPGWLQCFSRPAVDIRPPASQGRHLA